MGDIYTVQGPDGSEYDIEAPDSASLLSKVGTAMKRPGASVRARFRSLVQTGDIEQANKAADEGWKNPSSVETFQHENLRNYNSAVPEKTGEFTRFQQGMVPSAAGFAGDFISDPVQVGAVAATDGISKLLAPLKIKGLSLGDRASKLPISKFFASQEGQSGKAADLALKARDEATRLFPNAKGNLEDVRGIGEATSKYIRPAKNYEDVANQLEMAKGVNAGERQNLFDSGKVTNDTSQHKQVQSLMNEIEHSPLAGTQEGRRQLKLIKDIHTADVDFINSQSPETLHDPNFYQQQKEYFQGKANEAGAYRDNPSEAIKAKTYKAMSQGYQDKTYAVNDAVKPLNAEEGGLIQAHSNARELAKGEALDMKPNLGKEAVSSISHGKEVAAARFAKRTILDRLFGSPAKGITKRVSGLMDRSGKAQSIADLIGSLTEKPIQPEPLQLGSGIPSQAPVNTRPPIEMNEYSPSSLDSMAKKYGVPEYSGKMERKPVPRGKLAKTDMDKRVDRSLKSFAERRKKQ